ncbi:hypothetical protein [Mycobacterium sp. BK086]|uniref:hypothetical protein n=1 Tax=Mycobacterium sp. BK086 TaxID=2512165 RepID=UPI0010621CB9|nr:hypothetical protein [Mycobacterium sp. BK086]
MFGSSVFAPVAICTVIAAAAPALNPAHSPVFSPAATRTSAFQLTSTDSAYWDKSPLSSANAAASASLPFGLPQVLAIMTALAAFNPDAAATMQYINTELLDQLAQGTPLGVAMVNISLQLSPPFSGSDPNTPIDAILNQIGPMIAFAPTVISGAMTVLAAIPEAVIPVVAAVVVAVFNSAAAAGSDGFGAAVEAGLYSVMNAAAKGIATMVEVVQNVLHDIAGVVTSGYASRVAAPAAALPVGAVGGTQASGTPTKTTAETKRATAAAPTRGVAGPRPRQAASASATTGSDRSTVSARNSAKRDSSPSGTKGTAKSAR